MIELLFIIASIWLRAASITDLKKNEVSDWLSFSLLSIALALKAAESVYLWDYHPLLFSASGAVIFFVIASLFYYGKLFAGGDAKLMAALGAVIPLFSFFSNMLLIGGAYGILYSIFLAVKGHKRFAHEFKKHFKKLLISLLLSLILLITFLMRPSVFVLMLSFLTFFIPLLFFFVNSVEKSCLILKVDPSKLTVGDWLFKDVKIGRKTINADFEGLTMQKINLLKRTGIKVYIKYGIPFIPVFFLAFLATIKFGNLFALLI